uniref:C2H2-type domain-containing protein n=1 Tax=Macrostomum lignano TaxID=282301 RepID=A0A1I8FFI6_9PLAT
MARMLFLAYHRPATPVWYCWCCSTYQPEMHQRAVTMTLCLSRLAPRRSLPRLAAAWLQTLANAVITISFDYIVSFSRHGNASQAFDCERFDGNGNLQDPVSAVAVPSFSLMTDCADNLIDSSASSASHQFQEIFPPLADIDIGAYGDDSGARANGGNIASSCCSLPAPNLVAASARVLPVRNCGLCCQGADRMRAHKTASGHLGLSQVADPFDTFKCAQCADQLESRQAVLRHVALHGHERYQKKRPKMTAPPAGAAVAAVPSAPSGPFDCAVCGRGLPAVSDLTAHAAQTGHSHPAPVSAEARKLFQQQSKPAEPPAAVGSSRPSPVVTLGRRAAVRVPAVCTAWTAGVVAQNEHGKRTGHYSFQTVQHRSGVSGGPTCYKCLLCHQRMSTPGQVAATSAAVLARELFASLVDDCSRLADGAAARAGLPYLRVRLCPMRPRPDELDWPRQGAHIASAGLNATEKCALMTFNNLNHADRCSVGSSACRSSAGVLTLPASGAYRLRFASDLPPHLNAAHRRPLSACARKPILLPPAAPAARRRPFDHKRLPPPDQTRRRRLRLSILAPPDAKRATPGDDRLLLCFTLWAGEFISLSALEVASFRSCAASSAGVKWKLLI